MGPAPAERTGQLGWTHWNREKGLMGLGRALSLTLNTTAPQVGPEGECLTSGCGASSCRMYPGHPLPYLFPLLVLFWN